VGGKDNRKASQAFIYPCLTPGAINIVAYCRTTTGAEIRGFRAVRGLSVLLNCLIELKSTTSSDKCKSTI
jgi:hypothetical protein